MNIPETNPRYMTDAELRAVVDAHGNGNRWLWTVAKGELERRVKPVTGGYWSKAVPA